MRLRSRIVGAALLGAVAIGFGAFAAHMLGRSDPRAAQLVDLASGYQLIHAVAAVAVSALPFTTTGAPWAMLIGAALFGGSLQALALGAPWPVAWVTPVGGAVLMIGWLALAVAALEPRQRRRAAEMPENQPPRTL